MKDLFSVRDQERFEAMVKAVKDKENVRKAVIPDAVNKIGYDSIMKSFDADPESFTPDAQAFLGGLTKAPKNGIRVLEFVGSTERRDRDGDRIKVSGWDTKVWKTNPAFSWAHNYSDYPRAVGLKAWKENSGDRKALMFQELFPDDLESEEAQKMVDMVHSFYASTPPMLKAVSVGFLPLQAKIPENDKEREKLDIGRWGVYVEKAELWELAGCLIGANYDALKKVAVKTYGQTDGFTILDAMGMEVSKGTTTVDFSEIPEVKTLEVASSPSLIHGETIKGLISFETLFEAKAGNPEASAMLKAELEDRVRKGAVAKDLLTALGYEDAPEPPKTEPVEEPTETPEDEPSAADSDDVELPEDHPADTGMELYLDLIPGDPVEEPEPAKETPDALTAFVLGELVEEEGTETPPETDSGDSE